MRAHVLLVAIVIGCHPSATVENTMPVANLKSYRTVGLRVRSTAFAAQGQAMILEASVLDKLRAKCGFEQVGRAGATPSDVMLDLNITATGRGGGGWISNNDQATIDTLLVLSDGVNGELLGTVRIRGKSSGNMISGGRPENEAVDVIAKTVADLLAKSGCAGPRIARVEPPPPPPDTGSGSGSASAIDETKRPDAEKLNEAGKEKLFAADVPGALAAFQQAVALLPDPKYQYNLCLAYGAGEQWDNAIAACKQARTMKPDDKLAAKIDHRIELLQHRQ